MRKHILSLLMLLTVLCVQSVRADGPDIKRYATDESGMFYARCDYYAATDQYVITLTGIASDAYEIWDETEEKYVENPALKNLVFPSRAHVKFSSYNKETDGDNLEGYFSYELDQAFFGSSDYRVVETITFEEGVTAIPNYFYDLSETEVMTDMWEMHETESSVLREVTFPASVTSIGDYAFRGHFNIEKITFGSGLKSIGKEAFRAVHEYSIGGMGLTPDETSVFHSALTEINLPESLESIDEYAFYGQANVKSLTLHSNMKTIGTSAFDYTGIETLTADVPMLSLSGQSPFSACPISKLIIPCDGTSEAFIASVPAHLMHGVSSTFDVEFTPKTDVGSKCEGYVFYESCFEASGIKSVNLLTTVEPSPMVPSFAFWNRSFKNTYYFKTLDLAAITCGSPVSFQDEAFQYSGLETLTLNNRTNSIGKNAFDGTRIKSLEIPQYINPLTSTAEPIEIGEQAFYNAQKLESVRILGTIQNEAEPNRLAPSVFERCYALKTITLPASVEVIATGAFRESGLTSFTGGAALKGFEASVFAGCEDLATVDLSATSVTKINDYLFQNCTKLAKITFPEKLETVNGYAFENTALKEVDVPASLVKAFAFTSMPKLEKIRFTGASFETVVTDLLTNCEALTEVDFGQATTFEANSIVGCYAIDSLVIPANAQKIDKDAFTDIKGNISALMFKSTNMAAVDDEYSSPFEAMEVRLYFDDAVKNVPKYAFAGMHIINSPELRSDLNFDENAFALCSLDSVNWHYPEESVYPFSNATVLQLAFSGVKEIKDNLFANANIQNVYLDGVETIGESAFEKTTINGGMTDYTLTIPASVKEIKQYAFKDVTCDHLVFEKGEGLTIGTKAFSVEKGKSNFISVRSYYGADNIPAADGAFDIEDEISVFYAGTCSDVTAYQAADGWKDLNIKKWDGISEYKYSFEIIGASEERPIEFYEFAIAVNKKALRYALPLDCSNKMKIEFDAPCADMTFVRWADNTTDPKNYEITLTSDTVIRIYVEEKMHDVTIALKDASLSDAVTLLMSEDGVNLEEKTSGKVNECSPTTVDIELKDPAHYTFLGWYDGPDDKANLVVDYSDYTVYKPAKLYADVRVNQYYMSVEKDITICPECDMQLKDIIVNGTSNTSFFDNVNYNQQMSVTAVGEEGIGYRYVLDYWADEMGNFVSDENPYVFNMPDYEVHLRPVMKFANTYTVTAKSQDDALGTVTMTPETGAETTIGSGIFWEGSKIELVAASKDLHTYFKQWNDGVTENPRTISVKKSFEYVAEFEKDSFNITVTVEGIDPALVEVKGAGRYGYNDEVVLSYTLNDDHYTFDRWLGDKKYSQDAEFKFNVEKTLEVRIVFEPKNYTITVVASPAEGGTITGGGSVSYKSNLILKAVANEGYVFDGWEDDKDAVAERTVEVLGDATYTAKFVKETETGIDDLQAGDVQTVKEVRNGTLYIIRNGKRYDAAGQLVQ